MQIAEAVRDACKGCECADGEHFIDGLDLHAIIASIHAPILACSHQECKNCVRYDLDCDGEELFSNAPDLNRQLLDVETKRFLTDVITAAGLLYYGKTDKGLSSRINEHAAMLLTATAAEQQSQPEPVNKQLLDALNPFANLLKEHHDRLPDTQPIYGIGDSLITVGDMRRASAILAAAEAKRGVK